MMQHSTVCYAVFKKLHPRKRTTSFCLGLQGLLQPGFDFSEPAEAELHTYIAVYKDLDREWPCIIPRVSREIDRGLRSWICERIEEIFFADLATGLAIGIYYACTCKTSLPKAGLPTEGLRVHLGGLKSACPRPSLFPAFVFLSHHCVGARNLRTVQLAIQTMNKWIRAQQFHRLG